MSIQLKSVLPYAVGIGGLAIFVFIAFAFLEGTMRWIVVGVGVVDSIVTPIVLKTAMESETA